MGLGFLAPIFLAAAAAIGIPIWLHLTHKERKEVVEFPSLMFLERIPYKTSRRQRIRHPLLLALRALALLLLALAFARPVLERVALAAPTEQAREVVVLLDRSHSMGYGERWDAAVSAARRTVEELGPEDRASLVLFSGAVTVAVPSTTDRARLLSVLDTVQPGSRATRYGPALQAAAGILEDSGLPVLSAVLVSDFQRSGWQGDEGIRFPAGAELVPVSVAGDGPVENIAVAGVTVLRDLSGGVERVTLSPRITSTGEQGAQGLPVTLEVDGREVSSTTVDLPPRGAAVATLPPFTLTTPNSRVTVRIPGDRLPADDVHHLVLSPGSGIPVLVLDGTRRPGGALYLSRALEIGDDPLFRVEVKRAEAFRVEDLSGRRLVVFLDASLPGGELGSRLVEWVERGGGILMAPGERGGASEGSPPALLPGTIGAVANRPGSRGGTLGFLDYDHPILELFAAPRSGDLTSPRFFRTRTITPGDSTQVLARFDDGSVAMVERRVGRGRVMLWGGTWDTHWTDLPLQPVYLPLVRRTAAHLAAYRPSPPAWVAGDVAQLEGEEALGGDGITEPYPERVAAPPAGGAPIPLEPRDGTAVLPLESAGFYLVRTPGENEERPWAVAVNVDPAESTLDSLDPAELAASVLPRGGDAMSAAGEGQLTREDRERRQSLWWYLMVLALVILGVEAMLGNRLSRTAAH